MFGISLLFISLIPNIPVIYFIANHQSIPPTGAAVMTQY